MSLETPDDVLEHFGVKGMRWGVRNQRRSSSRGSSKKKRIAQVAVVAGVAIAATIIARSSGVRVRDIASPIATNAPRLGSAVANPLRTTAPRVGSLVADPTALQGAAATAGLLRRVGGELVR